MPKDIHNRREATLEKLRQAMEEEEFDALIAFSPENFYYACGWPSYFLHNYRSAGLAIAVVPRSEKHDPKIIISNFEYPAFVENSWIIDIRTYPIWVYIDESLKPSKEYDSHMPNKKKVPQGFGIAESFRLLAETLRELNLVRGQLGVEMSYIQQASWRMLIDINSDATFRDSTDAWHRARAIKDPWEIEQLTVAGKVAQRALSKSAASIREGTAQDEILRLFTKEAMEDPKIDKIRFAFVRVGEYFAPAFFPRNDKAKIRDLINYDVGLDCRGYCSDIARTFVLGSPKARHRKIFDVMLGAYEAALNTIQPGRRFSDVYRIGMDYVHSHGIPEYFRGHLGHSIGLGPGTEEPPFFSATEHSPIQPGMVLCLELPYYGHGIGAIMVEDMIIVNDSGIEFITDIARDLIEIKT